MTGRGMRAGVVDGLVADAMNGLPSTRHALATRGDPLAATVADGLKHLGGAVLAVVKSWRSPHSRRAS